MNAAIEQLRAGGYPVRDADLTRLSPFVLPDLGGGIRPLRDPDLKTTTGSSPPASPASLINERSRTPSLTPGAEDLRSPAVAAARSAVPVESCRGGTPSPSLIPWKLQEGRSYPAAVGSWLRVRPCARTSRSSGMWL